MDLVIRTIGLARATAAVMRVTQKTLHNGGI